LGGNDELHEEASMSARTRQTPFRPSQPLIGYMASLSCTKLPSSQFIFYWSCQLVFPISSIVLYYCIISPAFGSHPFVLTIRDSILRVSGLEIELLSPALKLASSI
jgi:hypothetical protein